MATVVDIQFYRYDSTIRSAAFEIMENGKTAKEGIQWKISFVMLMSSAH